MNSDISVATDSKEIQTARSQIKSAFSDTNSYDINFSVPQVQRLRFTNDVLNADFKVLSALIERSGPAAAKVQIWVDGGLKASHDGIFQHFRSLLAAEDHIDLIDEIQYVPGGEDSKRDPKLVDGMLTIFNAANLDRRSYILVIGGGAVLDAVGFAAATAHRGIRLIRIPTTTLSQGDSGVGVKNAINYFEKKNWLGTFATPWAVINDAKILSTLPDRDFRCGFAEAVKVSLLKSAAQFENLVADAADIYKRDPIKSNQALKHSVLLHLEHITCGGDPFEAEMARPLDFGHWSAHKLEPLTNYAVRHGEAVAIGVALDSIYSSRVHGLSRQDAHRVVACLAQIGLPTSHPHLANKDVLFNGLEEFRQHLGGELTITMINHPGQPVNVNSIDYAEMGASIDELISLSTGPNAIGRAYV